MKIDMVNFAVHSLRPHLMQHSVEYERDKFQQLLNKLPSETRFSFYSQYMGEIKDIAKKKCMDDF